jgi:hypothetical protein
VVNAYTIDHKPHIDFCGGYFRQKTLTDAMMAEKPWDSATGYYNKGWCHMMLARNHKLILTSLYLSP